MRLERLEIVVEPWRYEGGYTEVRVKAKANGTEYNTYDVVPENDFEPLIDVIMQKACGMIKRLISQGANAGLEPARKEG